jgi:hypothetical protein
VSSHHTTPANDSLDHTPAIARSLEAIQQPRHDHITNNAALHDNSLTVDAAHHQPSPFPVQVGDYGQVVRDLRVRPATSPVPAVVRTEAARPTDPLRSRHLAAAIRARFHGKNSFRVFNGEVTKEVNGEAVFGTPKTHQSRTVPVPCFLRDMLAEHVANLEADALVFSAPRGGVLRVGNFRRRYFDRAVQSIGLDGFVPHELRHTAASLAIAAGASVKGVQASSATPLRR